MQRALSSAPRETQNYVPGVQRRLSQVPQSAGFGRRPAKAKESERYRTLTADEVKALGLPEGTVAQSSPTGQVQIVNKPRDLPGAQTQVIDNGDGT